MDTKDIYYQGNVYVGMPADILKDIQKGYSWKDRIVTMPSYPVHGDHNWKDFQDVTGMYKLDQQRCHHSDKAMSNTVAVPLEVKEESQVVNQKANELIEKFKKHSMCYWHEVNGWDENSQLESAKECALICCDEILSLYIKPCQDTRFWHSVRQQIEGL